MDVSIDYRGIDIKAQRPPGENDIGPIISGKVRFKLRFGSFSTPLEIPFENADGEPVAKARAFKELDTLAVQLRAAIHKARVEQGL